MIRDVFYLLRRRPYYRYIVIGAVLSSIGTGLTQVAVYGELSRMGSSASVFSMAFALSVLPGLFSSQMGLWITRRCRPSLVLMTAELLGAVSASIPIAATAFQSPPLFHLSQFMSALLAGLTIPASNALISTYFSDEELPVVSCIGTYVFSANVLVGYGVGTLLYGQVSPTSYFVLDIMSYLIGAAMIATAFRGDARLSLRLQTVPGGLRRELRWELFTSDQKKAFLLMPILTLAGTPAVALLPAIAGQYGKSITLLGITTNPVMLFLLAKTLGQMIGPFVVRPAFFERLLSSRALLMAFIVAFGALYCWASQISSPALGFATIVFAHTISNVIYVVAAYAIPRQFKGEDAASVSARQYQVQVVLMTAYSAISGWAAEWTTVPTVIATNILLSTAFAIWIYGRSAQARQPLAAGAMP